MNNDTNNHHLIYKYNLSFYYQSTIIYFIVFVLYVIIIGEFVEGSFTLITHDPIIYLFTIIVFLSLLSVLYNLFLNKKLIISDKELVFKDRFKERIIKFNDIVFIKFSRERKPVNNRVFRLIRIKLKNRKRQIIIRPFDYENQYELIERMKELSRQLEKN